MHAPPKYTGFYTKTKQMLRPRKQDDGMPRVLAVCEWLSGTRGADLSAGSGMKCLTLGAEIRI